METMQDMISSTDASEDAAMKVKTVTLNECPYQGRKFLVDEEMSIIGKSKPTDSMILLCSL